MDAQIPFAVAAAPAEQACLIVLSLAAMAWALSRRPWQLLRRDDLHNGWLGALVLLALLWTVRATLPGGLAIQLFGATLMVTLFGLPLALVAVFVVCKPQWVATFRDEAYLSR
ncbi:hypothetical protein [Cupriavidus sp. CuC1]|uniref:hypothetical protein n=1 Tax=Cupriavidus sp. CuC1 TaxID=3373131 RepID=UPI0037D4F769